MTAMSPVILPIVDVLLNELHWRVLEHLPITPSVPIGGHNLLLKASTLAPLDKQALESESTKALFPSRLVRHRLRV